MDEYNNYQNGYNQNPPPPRRPKKRMNARWLWIIPVLILAAILVMDSFYTLKEDQYAVLTTFGKPTTVSASGLQPKIPLIQKVHKVSKSIQSFPLGYRVGSNESIEEESLMITYDYNFVNVDFYVEYRITDPIKYLYNSSDPVGILKMLCQSYIRDTIGLYNVDAVITTGKSEIQADIKQKIVERLETEDLGIQLTNITIPLVHPSLTVSTVLNVIYVFNSFPIIYTITKGAPANKTDTLITYLYMLAFYDQKKGPATALSVVGFLILCAVAGLYMMISLRKEDQA